MKLHLSRLFGSGKLVPTILHYVYIFQILYMSLNIALSCALRVSWFCALGSLQNILLSRGCRFCRIQRTLWWGKKPENGPNGYFTASMHWQMFRESPLREWIETNLREVDCHIHILVSFDGLLGWIKFVWKGKWVFVKISDSHMRLQDGRGGDT